MEEIKFRGKRVDNGEWVYGYYYQHQPPLQCIVPKDYIPEKSKHYILKTGFADWHMERPVEYIEVIHESVGQYTNRHDTSGDEIYIGHTVRGYGGEYCQGYWEYDFKVKLFSMSQIYELDNTEYIKIIE